ncbi:MAG: UvrD-helicase domain-containing protein, partial [Acidobacteria bacterium]|nr:UvrD-helicase domain-containing protein [Acidobacteriota bacterium]
MDFTARQLAAIRLADPPRDTCVVAGPGSGKTTVLIERFRQLMESGIPAARILAITFTEKATHQMRERLTERASVSTVHGLCARLLRENAIEAGVDPHFRVLDPQEAAAIELRAVSESLDAFLAECPAAIRALLAALASPDLGGSVLEVYETMRAAGTPVGQLRGGMPRADGQAALSALLDTCDRLAGERVFDWNASQREQLNGVLEWAGQLRGAGLRPAREHFQILESFRVDLNRIKKSGAAAGLLHALKKDQIPAARAALITDFYSPQRDTLLAAIERFDAAFRAHKRSLSALDFADLEESTVRLLQDHPAVREGVRAQFDCILMDEFQDTNGLQSKLLDLLRRPDCFYAVGDINQAIYGFRHADPEIFRAYREQVRRDGKQLAELRENWRSRPGILRAVSAILDGASGIEPHELIAARDFPAKAEPSVEVLSCIGADSADALALEAQWVARRIREMHERAPFRDFAVLFRSSTHIGVFTREFDQAGIPYSVTGAKGFYEAQEVADLIHLLRVVANARDEVSLAAVLRSPLAGVSDEALLRLRHGGNLGESLDSFDPALFDAADAAVLACFRSNLRRWRGLRDSVSADRILIDAMDEVGYEMGLTPRGRVNVEKLLSGLREQSRRRSLDEIVDELALIRDSDPREQDRQSVEAGDCVRVQTI